MRFLREQYQMSAASPAPAAAMRKGIVRLLAAVRVAEADRRHSAQRKPDAARGGYIGETGNRCQ